MYVYNFSVNKLKHNIILATIGHTLWSLEYPELVGKLNWDNLNFNISDLAGSYGTLTFYSNKVVAGFFGIETYKRLIQNNIEYDFNEFIKNIPDNVIKIFEEETCQYLLQEHLGKVIPIVTAVFWGRGNKLYSIKSWSELIQNEASIIGFLLDDWCNVKYKYANDLQLSDRQFRLLDRLNKCKFYSIEHKVRIYKNALILGEELSKVEYSRVCETLEAVGVEVI